MKLTILRDDTAESPRRAFDNLGTIATWHRRYNLGDEQPSQNPKDFEAELPKGTVVLPVFMLDHSGIALSTRSFRDQWDSGQLGIIYATPDKIRANFLKKRISAKTRANVEDMLRQEIETYNAYVQGDVWGYVLEDDNGNHVDSCWGYYGDDKNGIFHALPEEALALLDDAWDARQ